MEYFSDKMLTSSYCVSNGENLSFIAVSVLVIDSLKAILVFFFFFTKVIYKKKCTSCIVTVASIIQESELKGSKATLKITEILY